MRVSAHTYVTNPLSTGYLIYLPAVQSFLDFADEVVVVDGGSTDGSLEALAGLRGHERLVVVSNEQTRWGAGDAWERPQFGIQRQTGFERCTGDWAIAFDADHVLPDAEHGSLRHQLEQRTQRDVLLGFKLIECQDGKLSADRQAEMVVHQQAPGRDQERWRSATASRRTPAATSGRSGWPSGRASSIR